MAVKFSKKEAICDKCYEKKDCFIVEVRQWDGWEDEIEMCSDCLKKTIDEVMKEE